VLGIDENEHQEYQEAERINDDQEPIDGDHVVLEEADNPSSSVQKSLTVKLESPKKHKSKKEKKKKKPKKEKKSKKEKKKKKKSKKKNEEKEEKSQSGNAHRSSFSGKL